MKQFRRPKLARSESEVLEDKSIQLVLSAGSRRTRATRRPGDAARQGLHGRQTGPDHARAAGRSRKVQAPDQAHLLDHVYSERLENRATVRAGELVKSGAIGRVIQTIGMGPHRMTPKTRPAWFFERPRCGESVRHRFRTGRSVPLFHRIDECRRGRVAGRQRQQPASGTRRLRRHHGPRQWRQRLHPGRLVHA